MAAALDFPSIPTMGQIYPNPAVPGQPQYQWNGVSWLAVGTSTDAVRKTGDFMTGFLTLVGEPTADNQAATKKYVDDRAGGGTGGGAPYSYVDSQDALRILKAGDVMTGNLSIKPTTGSPALVLDKPVLNTPNQLVGRTNGKERWWLQLGSGDPETGANAGSNFSVYRYDDSGAILGGGLPNFTLERQTGNGAIYGTFTVTGNLAVSGNASCGDVYARRNATNGAYYFGSDQTHALFNDANDTYYMQGGNGLALTGGILNIGGIGAKTFSANPTQLTIYDRGGSAAMIVSAGADQSNYYRNNNHYFQNLGGGTPYLYMTTTGAAFYQNLTINGNCSVTGNLQANGSITSAGGRLIAQAQGGSPSVCSYDVTAGWCFGFWTQGANVGFGSATGLGSASTNVLVMNTGQFISQVTAYKPGGGVWADSSDERIKNVLGNYESGLDVIAALQPVRFTYKGNDTRELPSTSRVGIPDDPELKLVPSVPYPNSMHYQHAIDAVEFVGLVAQNAEAVMPELVTRSTGFIDGVEVVDLRNIDATPLIYALINAVKELKAEVEALKAQR